MIRRMAVVRIVASLVAGLLSVFALSCAAAPYSVRLGTERIVLDAPPGFSDTTELGSPRLQDLADTLSSPSNRVLLFALTDGDLRRFTQGDQLEAKRYMIVATPKVLEQQRVTPEQFAALVAESLGGLGKPVVFTDLVKFLESQPIGRANLLAELRKEQTVASVLQATRLPPLPAKSFWDSTTPQYLVFTTTLLYIRGKALRVSVFSLVQGPADLEWLRTATQRWVDDLQRLNK